MKRTQLTWPLVLLALLLAVIFGLPRAYAWSRRPSITGLRVGMTQPEFVSLKLPARFSVGSGPMVRYSEVYEIEGGDRLATLWNYGHTPPRLLWFKLNP